LLSVRNIVGKRLIVRLKTDEDAPYFGKELFFSTTNQGTPKEMPCLNYISLGEPQTGNDLERKTQNFIISTFELKAYGDSKKSYTSVYDILDKAGDVMVGMGYEMIAGIEDISDGSAKIAMARFRRTVGAGDSLY
jgi:hypothetical protein